jgi:hypothetical protein
MMTMQYCVARLVGLAHLPYGSKDLKILQSIALKRHKQILKPMMIKIGNKYITFVNQLVS